MLDAKIVTVEDRTELDFIVPSPNIQVKEYNKVYHTLDRLQSVMKTLNIQKAKNNEEQGLGKICRDLEYCIYDLGLWAPLLAPSRGQSLFSILDDDIWEFSKDGDIIIMGDFNARGQSLFSILDDDIWEFSNDGDIIIMGDFNARTTHHQTVFYDTSEEMLRELDVAEVGLSGYHKMWTILSMDDT
ncbi:hypothetical protein L7F22_027664 [Adiantum nelumboides]|nr:hypothetical protein [Adiantum nelumboides]